MEFKVVKFSRVMPKIEGKRGFHELMKGILLKADWKFTGVNLKKMNFLNIYFLEKIFFNYLVQIRF